MAWATIRNKLCDGGSSSDRARQFVALMCESLLTAGWSLVGQGGGTGSGIYQFNTAGGLSNLFAAFPAVPAAQCWVVLRNADGLEICLWNEATNKCSLVVSPATGFVAGSSDEDTPPADPADAWDSGAGTYTAFGNDSYQTYITVAYTDDATSFIVMSRSSGNSKDWLAGAVIKLADVALADALPASCPYHVIWLANYAYDLWESNVLSELIYGGSVELHPGGTWQAYALSALQWGATEVMDDIPADPITGEQPRVTTIAGCAVAGYRHVRGSVPGIWRVPGNLATGDKLDSDTYMVFGDYCVPWGSSDTLQS